MSGDFLMLLYKVSEDLGAKDCQDMIFLCGKDITVAERENIHNARDLFTCMCKKNLISESDMLYLKELLYRIKRIDILNNLYKKLHEDIKEHNHSLATPSKISAYRDLLYTISENIDGPGLDGLKYCVSIKTAKTVLEVFVEMEKAGKISQDNLKNLKRVFETMNRMDLLKYIKKFEEQVQGSQVNNIQYGIQDISFQESTVENSKETKSQEETLEHLETYAMKKKPHGWCVVINNRDFTEARSLCKEIEDRNGTDLDAAEIKNVFESRNYIFKEHKNLTGKRILETMEIYANESHDDKDSFVCFILSHGKLGEIFGTDGELIPIRRLTACFNGQHCKSLVGKPKIFFIQACQGDKLQQLVTYETDSPENTDDTKYDCLPVHADFLTAFATVEDYVSIRHTRSGSIYIQTLCKALNDPELYNTELCYILTNVNKKISEDIFKLRNKNIKQMPSFKSELRKRLILPAPVAATQSSELTS